MSAGLNVIALISGGKDSLFSLLHCIQNGHNIVALANLCPPPTSPTRAASSRNEPVEDLNSVIHCPPSSIDVEIVEQESSDLNSFMYQTVGHTVIPLYSTALQLPLYRQYITGSAVQQSQYYDTSSSIQGLAESSDLDETEDLVPLLRQVTSAHPEANALSTGAILSTYQRTRVESIALQLGLTPLSYLWQYPLLPPPVVAPILSPQPNRVHRPDSLTGLLEDISLSGLDARIIKIASAGISDDLLFANVADRQTQSRLLNGLAPFFEEEDEIGLRGAVLGEGGEYETIVLNGPREVWKGGRIDIASSHNEPYTESGVSYIKFGRARIVPHDEATTTSNENSAHHKLSTTSANLVAIPSLFDHQFVHVKNDLGEVDFDASTKRWVDEQHAARHGSLFQCLEITGTGSDIIPSTYEEHRQDRKEMYFDSQLSLTATSSTLTISNLTSQSIDAFLTFSGSIASDTQLTEATLSIPPTTASSVTQTTAAAQFEKISNHLPTVLAYLADKFKTPPLSTNNICSTTLLLNSISDFALVNPIYAKIYPKGLPNPPARVTIAAPLPANIQVSLSLTLDLCARDSRRGLHVQGLSYWAPANIGPYSQAIAVPLQNTIRLHDNNQGEREIDTYEPSDSKLEIVHIAGQIPSVPSSMEVHPGPFLDTAILSAQHLWRVGQERGVDAWPWGVAYLAKLDTSSSVTKANIAAAVWRQAHLRPTWTVPQDEKYDDEDDDDSDSDSSDEDAAFDVWDVQRNRSLHQGFRNPQTSTGKHRHILPNHNIFQSINSPKQRYISPFIAVEVNALPRNVEIEWWSNGIAGLAKSSSSGQSQVHWQHKTLPHGSLSCLTIIPNSAIETRSVKFITYQLSTLHSTNPDKVPTTLSALLQHLEDENSNQPPQTAEIAQGTAFVTTPVLSSKDWTSFTPPVSDWGLTQTTTTTTSSSRPLGSQVTIVPCHHLWGRPMSSVHHTKRNPSGAPTKSGEMEELAATFLLRVNVS